MATKKSKSVRKTSNNSSFPWGWLAAALFAVLLFATWANSITRVDVGTVQGDLAKMQEQLTAQAAATQVPTMQPAQPTAFVIVPTTTPIVVVPTTVYNGTTEKVVDDGYRKFRPGAWVGDDFGPEHTLPGWVYGPAIAELKPYMEFACGSVRVNKDESLYVHGGGAFWEAGSQNALIERWSHHVDEYTTHYPECSKNVYASMAAFLAANPTYSNHE